MNMSTSNHVDQNSKLLLKWLGIDTYKESIIYVRRDCVICKSEGFEMRSRVHVILRDKTILATINYIDGDLLNNYQASLSRYAWKLLGAREDDEVKLTHPRPLQSLSFVRSKIYGDRLSFTEFKEIIDD